MSAHINIFCYHKGEEKQKQASDPALTVSCNKLYILKSTPHMFQLRRKRVMVTDLFYVDEAKNDTHYLSLDHVKVYRRR